MSLEPVGVDSREAVRYQHHEQTEGCPEHVLSLPWHPGEITQNGMELIHKAAAAAAAGLEAMIADLAVPSRIAKSTLIIGEGVLNPGPGGGCR